MNSIDNLTVKFHDRIVGTLSFDSSKGVCIFRYAPDWLVAGFSISPTELPLSDRLFVAKPTPFRGNFSIFEDSLPDGYGRYLLHKMLHRMGEDYHSLSPLQLLSIVGEGGMGALTYHPVSIPASESFLPELDVMQELALEVLGEKRDGDEDVLYYNSGNSGGCRPKCLYTDEEGHWLVKFRHTYDPADMGVKEYEQTLAAKRCGIDVPDFKLIDGKYFASRRFDIDAEGNRLHMATAAALLGETIFPPMTDYRILLHLTGYVTQDPAAVVEMFRRMAFNVFAENKDDHAKNFTFIYKENNWRLAPAYDLTRNVEGYHGEHATSVNYNGNPGVEDMLAVARSIRIPESQAKAIIEEVRTNL